MSIHYQNEDMQLWENLDDAVVGGLSLLDHVAARVEVDRRQEALVEFTAPSGWPMGYWEKNQRYYVEFVREGLDAPGEWYLDRSTGVLTYYPRPGEDMTKAEVMLRLAEELLRLEGDPAAGKFVEHLRFEGLSFQHTDWIMPEAETVDGQANAGLKTAVRFAVGARNCVLERCEIAHTGGYGLWLQHGSQGQPRRSSATCTTSVPAACGSAKRACPKGAARRPSGTRSTTASSTTAATCITRASACGSAGVRTTRSTTTRSATSSTPASRSDGVGATPLARPTTT